MDLALNNLQRLICHKTQPTKVMRKKYNSYIHQVFVVIDGGNRYCDLNSNPR